MSLGLRRNDRMRNHLKNCGTISFAYLLDFRFLLFLFSLKGESTQLLSRLSCVFFNSDIFKSLLSKYGVLCFDNILQIRKIVYRAFELHCESIVTS